MSQLHMQDTIGPISSTALLDLWPLPRLLHTCNNAGTLLQQGRHASSSIAVAALQSPPPPSPLLFHSPTSPGSSPMQCSYPQGIMQNPQSTFCQVPGGHCLSCCSKYAAECASGLHEMIAFAMICSAILLPGFMELMHAVQGSSWGICDPHSSRGHLQQGVTTDAGLLLGKVDHQEVHWCVWGRCLDVRAEYHSSIMRKPVPPHLAQLLWKSKARPSLILMQLLLLLKIPVSDCHAGIVDLIGGIVGGILSCSTVVKGITADLPISLCSPNGHSESSLSRQSTPCARGTFLVESSPTRLLFNAIHLNAS